MDTPTPHKDSQFPDGIPNLPFIPEYVRNGGKEEYCENVVISKEMVDFLIKINTHNRNLRPRVSEQYQRDMQATRWHLTCQGIGIVYTEMVIDGVLCPVMYVADGQHRLYAIRAAGYPPVKILVQWNMKPESQAGIDLQAKRQAQDMLRLLQNRRVAAAAPAIARILLKEKLGWRIVPSMQEVLDTIQDIEMPLEQVLATPQDSKFFAAPYLAAFVTKAIEKPEEFYKVKAFMQRVEKGEMLKAGNPELTFRTYLLNGFGRAGGTEIQQDRFRKTMRALKAFYAGEQLHLLR